MIDVNLKFSGARGSHCYILEIVGCLAPTTPHHILHNMPMGHSLREAESYLKDLNAMRTKLGLANFRVAS